MNADEIVKVLRDNSDVYFGEEETYCSDIADLIESLQAQLAEYKATGLTPGDVKDLQGLCKENGLAEYVDIIVEAKRQLSKDNEQSIEQDERVERLEAQFAESQRRAQAAVEDMKRIVDAVREEHGDETCCFACKYDCDMSITGSGAYANECPGFDRDDCFEWCGPQEAGEGESHE